MASSREAIAEGKFLNFVRRGRWEYAERRNISGIVGIVAVTERREILLVEQHRPPLDRRANELPAGLAGDGPDADESLESAARRELLEETGFEADTWRWLFQGVSSPGTIDEVVDYFLATDLRRASAGGGDSTEEIGVHEVPVDHAHKWLARQHRNGLAIDVKIYAGLYFAQTG